MYDAWVQFTSATMSKVLRPRIYLLFVLLLTCSFASTSVSAASWFDRLKDAVGSKDDRSEALTTGDIGEGLKEALRVGTETVVANLGATDGFNLDPEVHIPLPRDLARAKDMLERVGMDSMLTDLELRLNRAAEAATPKAKRLFVESIQDMTLDDVTAIYDGPEDSATQFFRSKMSAPLAEEMKPVVADGLAEAGAVQVYDAVMERYEAIPFAPEIDADLNQYVVERSIDGIFHYLAIEEAAIRQNPAKRTTDLLKKVFGAAD